MATKSPTTSVRSREIIGVDQFSQRREVFGKHDTVFMPLPSPTTLVPASDVDPIVTSNHGKTTSNFKRNTPGYSSMRESRTDDERYDYRPRKYSDNFTSELNQSDDVEYRHTMTERTRRLSKLRRDFLNSNLHEPGHESPFARTGLRASLPANSPPVIKYKIESPNLYKFPFAEPYSTPTPVRRVVLDLGPIEIDGKENQDPEAKPKHQSLPNDNENTTKIDHQKLFEELVKRYSPQRKPVNWNLPPTRPRIVGSVPKSTSSAADSVDSNENKKNLEDKTDKPEDDDVFEKLGNHINHDGDSQEKTEDDTPVEAAIKPQVEIIQNGTEADDKDKNKESDSKVSLTELEEKNDEVPELSPIHRQLSRESTKRPPLDTIVDLTIPDLIEKMTHEGVEIENHTKAVKKVKRKRSFLDKLLGRKKDK